VKQTILLKFSQFFRFLIDDNGFKGVFVLKWREIVGNLSYYIDRGGFGVGINPNSKHFDHVEQTKARPNFDFFRKRKIKNL
jgi:hypothetical protein